MSKSQQLPIQAFHCKMSLELAKYMANKPFVELNLPNIYALGCKLAFQEYIGAPTGRLDVCTIVGYRDGRTVLARRFCWHLSKYDVDLKELGLTVNPGVPSYYTKKVIPIG
jgi:hypothetical protein